MHNALNPCLQASTKIDIATCSGGSNLHLGVEAIRPESHPEFLACQRAYSRLFVSNQHLCRIENTCVIVFTLWRVNIAKILVEILFATNRRNIYPYYCTLHNIAQVKIACTISHHDTHTPPNAPAREMRTTSPTHKSAQSTGIPNNMRVP